MLGGQVTLPFQQTECACFHESTSCDTMMTGLALVISVAQFHVRTLEARPPADPPMEGTG